MSCYVWDHVGVQGIHYHRELCLFEWPALLPGAMVTSKPRLLLKTMSGYEAQKQSESGMMSTPGVRVNKQKVLGTMSVKIRGPHWASPVPHWPWDSWSCPSLDTKAGELVLPPMGELIPPLREGGHLNDLVLGDLTLPLTWGGGPDQPAQLTPRPTTWALGWPALTSAPSVTWWSVRRNWSYRKIATDKISMTWRNNRISEESQCGSSDQTNDYCNEHL